LDRWSPFLSWQLQPLVGVGVLLGAFSVSLFWAFLGGFIVGLSLFWLGTAETGRLLLASDSQSNSYYKALGIRLIAKEPRGRL